MTEPRAVGPLAPELPEGRFQRRFGLVLVLLLLTYISLALEPTGAWTQPVIVLLQGATLVAALFAAGVPARWTRVAVGATALAFVATTSNAFMNFSGRELGAVFNVLLITVAPVAISWSILRRPSVDLRTILGAICVYVLIGMWWSFIYLAVDMVSGQQFFAQLSNPSTADFQYFSFVTLTTVGYGDLSAVTSLGRALVVLEALMGQLYLVTVVAVLVSNLSHSRRARLEESDDS